MATLKNSLTSSGKARNNNSSSSMSQKTFNSIGNLIRLLPTGTVFLYQFANPLLTNGGDCSSVNKILSGLLFGFCGVSCFLSSFTDSYTDGNGNIHYGFATFKGFFPNAGSGSDDVDLSKYKIQIGDFVHAFLALIVFGVVSLLDANTVKCFYPSFESTQKVLLMALPPVIGTVAGTVFVVFPNKRHGIGYPASTPTDDTDQKA